MDTCDGEAEGSCWATWILRSLFTRFHTARTLSALTVLQMGAANLSQPCLIMPLRLVFHGQEPHCCYPCLCPETDVFSCAQPEQGRHLHLLYHGLVLEELC